MNLLLDTYVFLWFVIHSPETLEGHVSQIETAPRFISVLPPCG
jgi:hypothetical protein